MSVRSRISAAFAAVAALVSAAVPAAAQTTIITNTGTRAISVSNDRVYYSDPTAEFCNSQRSRSVTVVGTAVIDHVTVDGCPFNNAIKADGAYVFAGSLQTIVRFWAGGTNETVTPLVSPSIGFDIGFYKIDTQGDWVYWLSSSAVGRVSREGTNATQIARATTFRNGMTAAPNGYVYWTEGNDGAGVIKRADLSSPSPQTVTGGTLNSPSNLVSSFNFLYWSETNGAIKRAPLTPGSSPTTLRPAVGGGYTVNSLVVDDTHVYWLESTGSGIGRIMKVPVGGGSAVQVGPGNLNLASNLQQDAQNLYWLETINGNIRRMPKDAAAVLPDMTWLGLEVTQGIQNIAGDVPLVRGKPTLVRGYARSNLPGFPNVTATLTGVRTSNGASLPGSPLRSSVAMMTPPTDVSITDARRKDLNATFNWEVPDSWLNNGVTLTATINANGAINESNSSNNNIVRAMQVRDVPPVCIKLRRTRTEVPTYEASGAAFHSIINRYRQLTPARDIWLFPQSGTFAELECCTWSPPFVYWGAWEVANDKDMMIVQLITEETFSGNPDQCDDANAPTHRVAMVSPNANTGSSTGYANYVWNVSWVKFSDARGPGTLAQEIAHNYNGWPFGDRWLHVNCGQPDGINPNYPYPTNTIGPIGSTQYYGYNFINRTVIAPDAARDYMSYCSPTWVSDYNWRGMMDTLGATPLPAGPPPSGNYLMAIGTMDVHGESAQVLHVYRIPDGTIPTDHLANLLAQQDANTSDDPEFRLDLRTAAGTVVQSQGFDVAAVSHEHGGDLRIFTVLLPDNPATASVHVMRSAGGPEIGSLESSSAAPVVSAITSPAAGSQITNALTISWTASDPDGDTLSYIVQYSRDNGQSWEVLAANTPDTTLVVDAIHLLPGSANSAAPGSSRIRIIASDGFRTSMLTSNPFRVTNRQPLPTITLPRDGAVFSAGESIRFRGVAFDPEDGQLLTPAVPFQWTVNGSPIGSGHDVIHTNGFAPGTYTAVLDVRDSLNLLNTTSITFTVIDGVVPPLDQDGDGLPDTSDNCPLVANAAQTDADGDGHGDACDNCPMVFNLEQGDLDRDGVGNDCDVQRLYVNAAATGLNNGLSWANAFTSLESALSATDTLTTVEEIWVAQGRYVPTARTNEADPRSARFRLRPGVSIYGGFDGHEHHAEDADPAAHPTILSGDISNNDGPNFANRSDNVYTVLECASSGIVSGLTVSGGNAVGISPSLPGGVKITGMFPIFRRCDIVSNQGGSNAGGGVDASFVGSPTFEHCRFLGNTVAGSGGGVRVAGGEPRFFNCVFTGNLASGPGSRGGAVATFSANPSFVNCTVVSNYATNLTGGIHIDGNASFAASVVNCIVYANVDSFGANTGTLAQIRPHNLTTASVSYSCVQGGHAGVGNISTDPMLADLDGTDGIIGTQDDQPRPVDGAPVNDAGSNAYAIALATDITGGPRLAEDPAAPNTGVGTSPIVDMGAYEWRPTPCPADFDGNGVREVPDIFAFLSAWFAQSPAAAFDGMNGITVPDIFAFLSAWFGGC